MHSEGTVVVLSVCLSMLKLACSKFIRSTIGTTYTHNRSVKICVLRCRVRVLQTFYSYYVSRPSTDKHMSIMRMLKVL